MTGGLVFNHINFVQVLEGEEADVRQLIQSISRDPRHTDVRIIEARTFETRLFGAWSMGYASSTTEMLRRTTPSGNLADINAPALVSFVLELVSQKEKIASTSNRTYIE